VFQVMLIVINGHLQVEQILSVLNVTMDLG